MGFQDLPVELNALILAWLDPNERLNVACTCRSLYAIVEPILYTIFKEYDRDSIPLLLLKLVRNPGLGERFKTLQTSKPYPKYHYHSHFLHEVNDHMFIDQTPSKIWRGLMETYYKDHTELLPGAAHWTDRAYTWTRSMEEECNWASMNAFLLLFLPNLKTLSFENFFGMYEKGHSVLFDVFHIARKLQIGGATTRYSYSSISEILINKSAKRGIFRNSIDDILSMLQLPSVRTFECSEVDGEPLTLSLLSETIHVRQLRLTRCGISTPDISHILARCHLLEHLWLGVDCRDLEYSLRRGGEFQPCVFFNSILHLQDRLQTLTILNQDPARLWGSEQWLDDANTDEDEDADLTPIPSLTGFTKLRKLHISSHFLLNRRVLEPSRHTSTTTISIEESPSAEAETRDFTLADLPPSLERLTICETPFRAILREFQDLNYASFNVLPRLRLLECHFTKTEAAVILDREMWKDIYVKLLARRVSYWFNFSGEVVTEEEWVSRVRDVGEQSSLVLARDLCR